MRKADKRALGEAKAKREAEERRQSGLAAQKMAREADIKRRATSADVAKEMNQKHRSTLLNSGINPSTGLIFSDYDMAEMERKANTPERRRLFERIQAGRAGTLNKQPPLGGIDDYVDSLPEMTVGDFKDMADAFYTKSQERMRRETASNPERALEFAKALTIGGFFEQAAEGLDRMAASSRKVQEAMKDYRPLDDASGEKYSDGTSEDRMPRTMETQEALKNYIVSDMTAAEEVYGMRRRGDSTDEKYSDGYTIVEINEALSTFNESGSSE